MDFFTHALLPYLLGNFFKRKKDETIALILGGIAPDIDIFILWINYLYPNFFLITHRGITHSFFFGFFAGIALLYLASRAWVKTKVRKFIDFEPAISSGTVAFAYAGIVIHLFLDYITTNGIPLFYPLSTEKYAAEVFFFTDTYLTMVSLIIIIFLFKKPHKNNTKFLFMFIIIFAALGALRIAEKASAEDFFQGKEIKAYSTASPFDWYVLEENVNEIKVYKYNGLNRTAVYSGTFLRQNVISEGENPEDALKAADELPQVKMFKWRAYAVAVNASFNDGAWFLEYYDPMRRVQMRDATAIFRGIARGFVSLRVTVEGGKAVIS